MTVGRLGHGRLEITGGGQLVGTGTSSAGGANLLFGGNSASVTGGTFDALISGQNSTLSLQGTDASFVLGRMPGASGTMTVDGGAKVEADLFVVGRSAGSSASLTVSGSGTTISLTGDPEGALGASFTVGAAGTGTMTVDQGAVITIDGTATSQPTGFSVGGATGGTGYMTISGGAQVLTNANGRSSIGSTLGSTGAVTATDGGSLVDAGTFLGIGQDQADNPGGTGTLTVSSGGTVKATTIHCGGSGTINGDGGVIVGNVIADPGCVISPGGSPGTLSIIGSLTSVAGKIVLEVDAFGNHDVRAVEGAASFDPATQVEVRVDPAFRPPGGTVLQMVQVQATPQDPVETLLTLTVAESGGGTVETQGDLSSLTQPPIVVPDIAIPASIRAVQIDIKPGAFPNVINLGSAGAIPVAILSTPAFDALTVDPLTITLDGSQVKLVGKGQRPLCSAEDVNGDGRKDLLCHIVTSGLPEEGDGVAILDGMTFATTSSPGIPIRGAEFIRIVP